MGRAGTESVTRAGVVVLLLTLAAGVLVRVAFAPMESFQYDADVMRNWSHHLVNAPLSRFYAEAFKPDHLPGDLILLSLLAHLFTAVRPGVPFSDESYLYFLKAVPFVADIAIALMLFVVAKSRGWGDRSCWLSAAYLLNPAVIFVSAVWGQWDAVSGAFALGAVVCTIRRRWWLGVFLLGLGCLIKPQLGMLLPLIAVVAYRRVGWRGIGEAVCGGVLAIGAVLVASRPFGVSMWPISSTWTLVERMQFALDTWQQTTARALNVWILPIGAGRAPLDSETWWLLSYQQWGMLAFGVVYAGVLVVLWRTATDALDAWLVWAAAAVFLGWYMLFTRVHERYLFPTVMFLLLWLAWERRAVLWLMPLSLIYLVNLYWVYDLEQAALGLEWLNRSLPVVAMAGMNVLLLMTLLLYPGWLVFRRAQWPPPEKAVVEA